MAPRPRDTRPPSPTTTVPPSPTTTVPGARPPVSSDVAAIIAAMQQQSESQREYYAGGVTKGYKVPSADKFGDPANPYLYTNDDWQILLTKTPTDVATIQRQLMTTFPDFTPGRLGDRYDPKTIEYFKKALAQINTRTETRGQTIDTALATLTNFPMVATPKKLPSYQLTSPTDLRDVFKKAGQQTIGRELNDQQLSNLVKAFNDLELKYQRQVSAGGTTVRPPSAERFAAARIEKMAPVETEAQQYSNYIGALAEMLGA